MRPFPPARIALTGSVLGLLALPALGDDPGGWSTKTTVEGNLSGESYGPRDGDVVVDRFGPDWYAQRVSLRTAHAWDSLPPLAKVGFEASRWDVKVHLELALQRDLEAFREDPLGGNWIASTGQVDINQPHEGWISAETKVGSLKLGRFPWTFGGVPHGVILGGAPSHDGLLWELPMGRVHYTFLGSSLNPWLNGTPVDSQGQVEGSGATGPFAAPVGSETWQQEHDALGDQYGRIYDEPVKTLFAHVLAWDLGQVELSVIEQTLVGGKDPAFRDLSPFVLWHDDYGDGYSRSFFSFQVKVSDAGTGLVWTQLATQLVKSPFGGEDNYDPPTQAAAALGWSKRWFLPWGILSAHQELAATTPTYDNSDLPLLKMVSRRVFHSNVQDQSDPLYTDEFEVDDPLGYGRGPDACDLWDRVDWLSSDGGWSAGAEVDWLQQGDASLSNPASDYLRRTWPLSGIVEHELDARLDGSVRLDRGLEVTAGAGMSAVRNRDHVAGNDGVWPLWSAGVHLRY
jgi:hypothetical protein